MVVEPNAEAGHAMAGGATVTGDLDEAFGTVDALVVAAPTPLHAEIVGRCIDAGIPVLCEKPLSFDPATSFELHAAAEEAGVLVAVGFWRRWARPWSAARELLAAGAIGEPILLRLAQWDANPPPAAFCARDVSGGIFIDCGVHEFELVDFLLGDEIATVRATALAAVDPAIAAVGDVDNGLVEFTTDGGVVGLVDLTRNARYADDVRTEILGSDGALFVDGFPGGRLRIGDSNGMRIVGGTEMVDVMVGGVYAQLDAFISAVEIGVQGAPSLLATARSSGLATAVGAGAWASLDTGGAVVSVDR